MRKYIHIIFLICLCYSSKNTSAQVLSQINIINFTVKSKLPADIGSWANNPASLVLVAQKIPQTNLQGAKLLLQIKQNGGRVCSNTIEASSIIDITAVRSFNANELTGYLNTCSILKGGNYSICAQFFNIDKFAISKEVCKDFIVEDGIQVQQSYTAPSNISPVNQKKFSETDAKAPITFRWVPVTPIPKQAVTYRLKVWQLMQGQNGSQAMRSNLPIVEKDVNNITQTVVANIYTGPCKPPYLCDYVWNVQALDKEGKPLGSNNCTSEISSFSFLQSNIQVAEITNLSPANNEEVKDGNPITFRWTIPPRRENPDTSITYRLKVWQLMQGQNGMQAMRTNKPIVTKDVADASQAVLNTEIFCNPPAKPCPSSVVWIIEALNKKGEVLKSSEPTTFRFGTSSTASTCPGTWTSIQCGTTAGLGTTLPAGFGLMPTMSAGTSLFVNPCYAFPSSCTTPSIIYELHDAITNALINAAPGTICGTTAFPIFTTTVPGAYIFKIYAFCSTGTPSVICDSSVYLITIIAATCCSGGSWGSNTWGTTPSPTNPLPVSGVINTGASPNVYFNCNYTCATGCAATITYKFFGSGGTLLSTVGYPAGATPPILIPSGAIYFRVIANCGSQSCDSITDKIIITPCTAPCVGSSWGPKFYLPAPTPVVPWTTLPCGATLLPMHVSSITKFNVVYNCAPGCGPAILRYKITGPGSYVWTTTVPSGTLVNASMPPTVGGALLTIQAFCGGTLCNTCNDKLVIVP